MPSKTGHLKLLKNSEDLTKPLIPTYLRAFTCFKDFILQFFSKLLEVITFLSHYFKKVDFLISHDPFHYLMKEDFLRTTLCKVHFYRKVALPSMPT